MRLPPARRYLACAAAVLSLFAAGCCSEFVDVTRDPQVQQITDRCYETTTDGFLYSQRGFRRSPPPTFFALPTPWALSLGVFRPDGTYRPRNMDDYLSAQARWDEELFGLRAMYDRGTIVAAVPAGTRLRILSCYYLHEVMVGSGAEAEARIESGELAGTLVEIGSPDVTARFLHSWLRLEGWPSVIEVDPRWLRPCAEP